MKIDLSEKRGIDLYITYLKGSILFGLEFGYMPRDCGWFVVRIPFLSFEFGWRSPRYDWDFYGR
jgi:hypothetical protein